MNPGRQTDGKKNMDGTTGGEKGRLELAHTLPAEVLLPPFLHLCYDRQPPEVINHIFPATASTIKSVNALNACAFTLTTIAVTLALLSLAVLFLLEVVSACALRA